MDSLAEGNVLSLKKIVDFPLVLEMPTGAVISISPGDFLVVLGVIWPPGKAHYQKAAAVLCMTRSGPVTMSRWLVSHWFAQCA